MKTITMLELRTRAGELVRRLQGGESFALSYRNRVVGEIRPVLGEAAPVGEDPAYRLGEVAEDLGEGLNAEAADQLLYGG